MTKLPAIGWSLLLLLASCSPKNEDVKKEQIDTKPVSDALDTIANTRKDAVKTDENNETPTFPLPQPVLQLLTQRYPGWQQPPLAATAQQHTTEEGQGPTLVRGDFNGDQRQDYALQLQQEEKVIIAAVLDAVDGKWEVVELKQDVLFNDRGTLKSLYYLYLLPKGRELKTSDTTAPAEAPEDALGVGMEDNHTAYLYQNGSFKAIGLKN